MESPHEQRVLVSYYEGGYAWLDILFEEYPCYDDDKAAPKELYVFYNSLMELRGIRQKHRDCIIEKIERIFGVKRENKGTAEEFYQQFTRDELICAGI
uniref:Uncharacterized protein n=1 Tax=Pithovirus LCPAC406 TaxID=2506599 RepID=A0A481ZD82_9VIRU|nr:MAG: uncharacterized protein LCPAC406_00510 [Pithovirus LCPAC406]